MELLDFQNYTEIPVQVLPKFMQVVYWGFILVQPYGGIMTMMVI